MTLDIKTKQPAWDEMVGLIEKLKGKCVETKKVPIIRF